MIRECAKNNQWFSKLLEIYENREHEARAARAAGKKVVGTLGCDVPDELVMAAGMLPVAICADPDLPLTETDRYLEYSFDPVLRAKFEAVVDGSCAQYMDHLAISNSTDTIIRIWLYLREIQRTEPEKPIPELWFIDWLFTRKMMHQVRNEGTIGLFIEELEKWSGSAITDEAVYEAAKICNRDRAALRRIQELRRADKPRINGSEALVIIGASLLMDRGAHAEIVEKLADDAAQWPELEGPRVFVTGSAHESTYVYDLLEDAGVVIVGEDHDWGDRVYERDFDLTLEPVRAAVDRYMLRSFSSKKAFVSQRVQALNKSAEACRADGVLFYLNIYEESGSWDYPSQKQTLEEKGILTCSQVKMQYPAEKNTELKEALQAFAGALRER